MIGKTYTHKIIYLGLLFLVMAICMDITVSAEDIKAKLEIDTNKIEEGVSTNLTVVIDNATVGIHMKNIEGIENFDIISSNTSSTTSIINGQTSQQIQYNYTIMPKNVGDYKLLAYIEYGGKTYKTNEINVHVDERSEKEDDEVEDLYIKTILSKESAFFGEKIVLTYEVYSRYKIDDLGFRDEVTLDGFVTKDLLQGQLKSNFVVINNKDYVKYEVKKILLTPTSAGTLKIPSYNFQVNVSTGDFFSSSKPIYLKTTEKEINIKQLPTNNKPDNFTGLVGQLELSSHYNKDEVDYGQSVTLNINLSGDSNIELMDKVNPSIDGVTIYETEKDLKEEVVGNEYHAQKEFEIILVPQKTGQITIEPITINYFDVATNSYKDLVIDEKVINVVGEMPITTSENINPHEEVKKLEKVIINQINTSQEVSNEFFVIKRIYIYLLIVVIVLIILTLIALSVYFVWKKQSNKDNKMRNIYKSTKYAKDDNAYYDILNEMIKYKYNISIKASSRYDIESHIQDKDIVKYIFNIMDHKEKDYRQENKSQINYKEIIKKIYKMIS
ncbi:MAG: BatD family protein [Vallitalea sp.]|jgi:heme/copper-type cytochrome/quinol oxidase subunit 2|nr:BatD family protein [Vallitalea sp.]